MKWRYRKSYRPTGDRVETGKRLKERVNASYCFKEVQNKLNKYF